MFGTRYEFSTMWNVISGRKQYRNTNNLEKSDFFVEKYFFSTFFLILTPFYSIWAMLGARYKFLTMRKVISDRKRYRNTNNLEKSDFFVEKNFFSDIFLDFDPFLPDLGPQNSFFFFFLIFIVLGFALGSFCTIPHYPSTYNTVDMPYPPK